MILVSLFCFVGGALAQMQVNGTVVSQEDNQPVIGASIVVPGTQIGAATDMNGKFSLTVRKERAH